MQINLNFSDIIFTYLLLLESTLMISRINTEGDLNIVASMEGIER